MSVTSELLWRIRHYLDDHYVVKWFVVPILFMASILFVLGLAVSRTTPAETLQLAGLFVGFSLAVIVLGLLLDRGVQRVTGGSLYGSDGDRG